MTKINSPYYILRQLLPECRRLYPNNDFIFMQDGASSHTSNASQAFLKEQLGKRFIKKDEWRPSSPEFNVLDFYFWNELNKNIYDGRFEPFQSIEQLKRKIRRVWNRSIKLDETRKAIK